MLQTLRAVLGGEGRERLESLPDGIHSGLMKPRAKGLFFYFQARAPERGVLHFWKYVDLDEGQIVDNRFIIANLIACDRDTPRVIGNFDVFAAQERVIEDILRTHREQQALEEAPRTVDPLQQTVATTIQQHMNRPEMARREALTAIRFLSLPASSVVVKELRGHYRAFQTAGDIAALVQAVGELASTYSAATSPVPSRSRHQLQRDSLRLICFDYLSS